MNSKGIAKKFLASLLGVVVTAVTVLSGATINAQAANESLLNTYGKTYGHVGTCINSWQLNDGNIMSHVKSQYNSITLENEMKPDALLGGTPSLISVSQAKSLGYYIPDNYKESTVPRINFSTMDAVLKKCYENGIGVRAHTLVWHSQTPTWFFRYGYGSYNGFVNPQTMDARMEMYIKTIMNHVYTGQYGSVVYAWDVVNEYLHAVNSGWEAVYGKGYTKPAFVKKAFQYAHDCLDYFKLTNKVSLFYNDFNTYMEVNDVISMINFINSNGKICNGVGMQSHLGVTYPTVDYYMTAMKSFLNAGFEVQITELDVTNYSSSQQASYLYNLFKQVNALKKNGAKITGITFWGLSDDVSWIEGNKSPLLFSRLNAPKESYYKVLQAYTETGFYNAGSTNPGNNNTGSNNSGSNVVTSDRIADGWYHIKNVGTQKYLTVTSNSAKSGANVEIYRGVNLDGQRWYVKNNANGTVTIKSGLGFMLDVTGGKAANSTNIEIWSENGKTPQEFMLKNEGNGRYGILTKVTNGSGCLDPEYGRSDDGTNVQQYSYYKANAQLWTFEKASAPAANNQNVVMPDGWYYIKNHNAHKYLQVANNLSRNDVNVEIGTGTGVQGQKWYVTNKGNGYVTLKNGQGYMLDVYYGKNEDGANIQTHTSNGENAQLFKIASLGNNQYAILTKVSNDAKALDVYNFATNDGANVCQWTYYKNANQIWYFEPCNN